MSEPTPLDPEQLRARFAADLAAGKTVALPAEALANPDLRAQLPELLEEVTRAASPAAAPPLRIPGYTLLGEIGHGGMSTVWLARQDALHRHVALKIAPRWSSGDPRAQERLLQEARAMARVSHPHIVAIHDILEVDEMVAIAMDWIDGLTLAQLIRALPPKAGPDDMKVLREALGTPAEVELETTVTRFFVRVARDIALALRRVHDAGLLHLDIKPSNILVRRDGTPLLADFGVVREINLSATHTRTFAGTPVYAAPEQLRRADAEFGPHTDIYGLALTLYEALARRQPLQQLGLTRVLQDVLAGRIPPLVEIAPVPADLGNIVHKAIAPEIGHRFASATVLAADLDAFLDHRPVSARPLTWLQRLRRWARNEPWKAALATALAVLLPALTALGIVLVLQMPRMQDADRSERRSQANFWKQEAYQAWFSGGGATGTAARRLETAMTLDPEATSLACLLSMVHEEVDARAPAILAEHATIIDGSHGLRLLRAKIVERRAFFSAEEVERLRHSHDVVDRYVLALDRLFRAEDHQCEEAYLEAETSLDQATMARDNDPLLLGLRAWAALRAGLADKFTSIGSVMRSRWPGDIHALSWLYLSLRPIDADKARAVLEEVAAANPRHARTFELRALDALLANEPRTAAAFVVAAGNAGLTSPRLTLYELLAAAKLDPTAAARALRDAPRDELAFGRRLALTRQASPADGDALFAEMLAVERQPPGVLKALYRDAHGRKDEASTDAVWQRWRATYPDRCELHAHRIGQFVARKDVDGVVQLAREFMLAREYLDPNAPFVCSHLTTARDWETLLAWAQRWLEHGTGARRTEAATHAGIAAARLGRPDIAVRHLSDATNAKVPGVKYAYALLDLAWIRVDPNGDTTLHEFDNAAQLVTRFDNLKRNHPTIETGAWTQLVRAEVAFAGGNKAAAIEAAERGLTLRPELHAPADVKEQLRQALARYGR